MNNKEKKDKNSQEKTEKFLRKYSTSLCGLIITLSLLVRYLVSLYGYSGEGDKPKFGDFEAHRHWFELTNNLNITDWYTNSEINPQEYWPIDYPPVCAYFHFIVGKITSYVYPQAVKLKNWGFESPGFKIYMRFTVIFSEIIFFYIPLFLLVKIMSFRRENKYTDYFSHLALILFNPVFILIDHGHFQYNCVMLGLFLYSLYFCFKRYYYLTIIFFILSINFKQMGLYYALVFFFFFIREIVKEAKGYSFIQTTFHLLRSVIVYGAFSIMVMLFLWLPWFKNYMHVITRIFPVWRGIFEDKVASFWCILNILYKLQNIQKNFLIIGSASFTLLSSLPSLLSLLFYNSKNLTNLSFFNVSISFFMFSFHVHEKTILLPLLPVVLCMKDLNHVIPVFTLVSSFSLFPLLQRENQVFTYYGLTIFYYFLSKYLAEKQSQTKAKSTVFLLFLIEMFDFLLIVVYHICEQYIPPPTRFPWLYPMLNATLSFLNFLFFYLYSNVLMLMKLSQKINKKVKQN